jgi:DNA-binding transcriptional LysR family regulator
MTPHELEVVAAVGRLGSLSRAARLLNVTTAAVSKRLANLEKRLGTRLFDRTTRRVTPTQEGQQLMSEANRLLLELDDLDSRISGHAEAASGHFRVLATLGYGREVLAPILSDYARMHPNLTIDLTLSQGFSEEFKAFDVAVALGAAPRKSFYSVKIASNSRLVVASPEYLRRHGKPRSPAELRNHRCLVMTETGMDSSTWALVAKGRVDPVRVATHMSSNDGAVILSWALAGHGIALRSEWTVRRLVESGALTVVLPGYAVPADVHAIWPRSRYVPARVTHFSDFLAQRIQGDYGLSA